MPMRLLSLAVALVAAIVSVSCRPPDVKVDETPVKYSDETLGRGRAAEPGDVVRVDYTVLLPDGKRLMNEEDFCFCIGAGAVIAGFDDGVVGMRPGGKRTVECPPHRHWGRQGYGPIPPNTTLTLRIKLVSIE
jgi:FKBP-type peptidyl-prolyl cis-trans isomerase